jgi:hypothetical protein
MSENKKDALGRPIIIGNLYGYTNGSSTLTIVTGKAKRITPTGKVSLEIESYKRAYYDNEPSDYPYSKKSISIVPTKIFPIEKEKSKEDGDLLTPDTDSKEYIQEKETAWLDTPKGTIYEKTGFENYIQPKNKKLRNTALGVDLDLLFGNESEIFNPIK